MYSAGNNINPLTKNNLTLINVFPKNLVNLTDNLEIIKFIHDYSAKNHTFNIITGGTVSRVNDFTVELYSYLPQMLLIILGEIYLLLFFYLKSIILPVKAAIMNFLPILSSFGLLTLVFQFGYFHNILKTPFNGAVTNIVPIVLFCIVFGLGMDYEVLILSRINESYQKNQEVKTAIIEGMSKSGSLITGAALILAGVFVPGIFSSSPQIQEICLGISSAVFIDATIVRIFLVPSFMMLMGKWNWWRPF
jgi:RND superfamily putative drug exporter